jgi:hypothetical protein
MVAQLPPEAIVINIGDSVVCDYCNDDYTNSDKCGGGIVGSDAVCPECIRTVCSNGQELDMACPEGMTFKEFVLRYRDGNDYIVISF